MQRLQLSQIGRCLMGNHYFFLKGEFMANNNSSRYNIDYGFTQALQQVSPFPIVANRSPGLADSAPLGTVWANKAANVVFVATSANNTGTIWTGASGAAINPATLAVGTTATIGTTLAVGTNLTVGGTSVMTGLTTLNGGLTVAGATLLNGGTVGIGTDANGNTISISTGAVARTTNIGVAGANVQTISIGGTGANVIAIANTQTAGSLAIGTSMTTGTISIGGTGLQTGTISLAPGTGAQTVNIGTGGTGVKTIHIGDGAIGNIVTVGSTTAAAHTTIKGGTLGVSLNAAYVELVSGPTFIYSGAGAPGNGLAVQAGDLYIRTDPAGATSRIYVATAANTWTNVTCAA